MSRDLKQGAIMIAGGLVGWLIGDSLFASRGWEATCLVIGIATGQLVARYLFPAADLRQDDTAD